MLEGVCLRWVLILLILVMITMVSVFFYYVHWMNIRESFVWWCLCLHFVWFTKKRTVKMIKEKDQITISICWKIMHTIQEFIWIPITFIYFSRSSVLFFNWRAFLLVRAFFSPTNAVDSFYFEEMKYVCVIAEKTNKLL